MYAIRSYYGIEYHIVGMNPDDFPDNPEIEDIAFFSADSGGLKRMIEKSVVITTPPDEKRPHINGVYFERVSGPEQKCLRMVSTDGSRLSTADHPFDGEVPEDSTGVITSYSIHYTKLYEQMREQV